MFPFVIEPGHLIGFYMIETMFLYRLMLFLIGVKN